MPVDIHVEKTMTSHPATSRLKARILKKAASHFRALGLTDPELSIVITDDDHIQELNAEWRDEDHATDVLSFPLCEPFEFDDSVPGAALGDIVISLPYAERIASEDGHRARVAENLGVPAESLQWTLDDEVDFLVIHGLLHLIGHDHGEPDEEAAMRAEERRLWVESVKDDAE